MIEVVSIAVTATSVIVTVISIVQTYRNQKSNHPRQR